MPINATLRYAEEVGFEVRDVESLREHYMLTLRHWAQRLESRRDEALQTVNEPILPHMASFSCPAQPTVSRRDC